MNLQSVRLELEEVKNVSELSEGVVASSVALNWTLGWVKSFKKFSERRRYFEEDLRSLQRLVKMIIFFNYLFYLNLNICNSFASLAILNCFITFLHHS